MATRASPPAQRRAKLGRVTATPEVIAVAGEGGAERGALAEGNGLAPLRVAPQEGATPRCREEGHGQRRRDACAPRTGGAALAKRGQVCATS